MLRCLIICRIEFLNQLVTILKRTKEHRVGVQKSLFLSYLNEDVLLGSEISIDGAIRGLLLKRVDRKASH